LTPSGTVLSMENIDFAVFFTFMLQKRPKWLLFQNSLSKYLKSQKERFRAIFDQINSIPGLNDPLKVVHFSPYQVPICIYKTRYISHVCKTKKIKGGCFITYHCFHYWYIFQSFNGHWSGHLQYKLRNTMVL
jgi:hypothetical protein